MERSLKNYYDSPRLSQSKLKLLLLGVKAFNEITEPELFFEEKQHFIIGSAVDTLLTRGVEQFNQEFYVSNLENKPSDTVKSIINEVFSKANIGVDKVGLFAPTLRDYPDLILEACNNHSYQSNWKDETRVNKIIENFPYWEELVESNGKTILTIEDKALIDTIVNNLLNHEAIKFYFNNFADGIEIINQLHIDFEIDGVECKALLDGVIIDRNNKTLLPYDIKTTGDKVINFPRAMRKHHYQIQAAWYMEALKQWKDKSTEFKDYNILNFEFIVESTTEPGFPKRFYCSDDLLHIGKYGRPEIRYTGEIMYSCLDTDYKFPMGVSNHTNKCLTKAPVIGYLKLLEAYKFYSSRNDWSTDLINHSVLPEVLMYDTNFDVMDCFI